MNKYYLAVFLLPIFTCAAQTSPADSQTMAQVLDELEAMKRRIAQLEAQLKAAQTPPMPASVATPAPVPIPQTAAAIPPAQAPPADNKKPDPFSFADFTWLTGNPRTSESPLDTKVF